MAGLGAYPFLMGLSKLWPWLEPRKQSFEEIAEDEEERSRREKQRAEAIDQYYEEGFPSREAAIGPIWPL
jgi:hypothetical protein